MNYTLNKFDTANGEGIRITLFVSGCQFHCPECFNEEVQDYSFGKTFTEETYQEIIKCLKNPYVAGLSILGGDPLWQSENDMLVLIKLCKEVHFLNKNVWIWSGFTWEYLFSNNSKIYNDNYLHCQQELISSCDIFIDGLFDKEKKNLALNWRGSSNQRIIKVQESLKTGNIVLYE